MKLRGSHQSALNGLRRQAAWIVACRPMASFTGLIAWREASELAARITEFVGLIKGPSAPSVCDQLIRAANSIAANIAEGHGRGISRDGIRFMRMARSSASEVENHLRGALRARRVPRAPTEDLIGHARRCGYLILRLEQSIERRLRDGT